MVEGGSNAYANKGTPGILVLVTERVLMAIVLGKSKLLSKFICDLLTLPHSSACVERIFSQLNQVKTKQTNSLESQNFAGRILTK